MGIFLSFGESIGAGWNLLVPSEVKEVSPWGPTSRKTGCGEWGLARMWGWQPGDQVQTPDLSLVDCLTTNKSCASWGLFVKD